MAADAFTPTVFERTDDDGTKHQLTATSPADAVRLRFNGWTETKKTTAAAKKNAPAAG